MVLPGQRPPASGGSTDEIYSTPVKQREP